MIAWSGGLSSSAFESEDGNTNSGAVTTISAVTGITPAHANEMLVSFLSFSAINTPTINSSFGAADTANFASGTNEGIAMSWQIQTAATFRNPAWSWSTGTKAATTMDAYQAAAAGGGGNQMPPTIH